MSALRTLAERLSKLDRLHFPPPAYELGLYQLTEAAFRWLDGQTDVDIVAVLFEQHPPLSGLRLEVYMEIHDGVVAWSEAHDHAE